MYVYAFMYVCMYANIRTDLRFVIVFCAFFLFTCYQYWLFTCQWHCERKREGESQLRVHMSLSLEKYYCFLRYITTKYAAIPNVLSLSLFLYFCLCLSLCLREVTVLIGGVGCAVIIEQANWRLHKYATHTHTHTCWYVWMFSCHLSLVCLFATPTKKIICDLHFVVAVCLCTLLCVNAFFTYNKTKTKTKSTSNAYCIIPFRLFAVV